MGATTYNPIPDRRDTLRGTLLVSISLHIALAIGAAGAVFPRPGGVLVAAHTGRRFLTGTPPHGRRLA